MAVGELQKAKAAYPILVTLSGISVATQPAINVLLLVSIMALHPPRESNVVLFSATVMVVRLGHSAKAPIPMLATLAGMVMAVRLLQLKKAYASMLVTLSGMVMAVRLGL